MGAAIGWGALAASSLVIGAAVGLARPWPRKLVGLVLGFGAGALISAVSFELVVEGVRQARGLPVAIGLAVGALTYFVAAGKVAAMGGGGALALGAFLDGIPEQMVLGIGLASGEPVSAGLLAAIFVSNLPEAIGGANDMRRQMHDRGQVARNWVGI